MITDKQVKKLMKYIKTETQEVAAVKSGMDVKTARKYLRSKKLPSEIKERHGWRTRLDPFSQHWDLIEDFLLTSEGLEAQTMLDYLIEHYPDDYKPSQLRTLQRRFREWRAERGADKAAIFPQVHHPGRQSQSDFTEMNDLNITIKSQPFPHLLFHFMLVYSRWEDVMICESESFENLMHGYEQAVWCLGGLAPEHRTDNLSAAVNNQVTPRQFTERWSNLMKHYKVVPTTNNPGESNENGSIEKSHDLLKKAIKQQLILRRSSDFESIADYQAFLETLVSKRNKQRASLLREEIPLLQSLPVDKFASPRCLDVKVRTSSIVRIDKVSYSVPSRLIGYTLRAKIYQETIELYYSNRLLQTMNKVNSGYVVHYKHIIDSLVRKPGAFFNYCYQAALFPNVTFRLAYDVLSTHDITNGHKHYLNLLRLAKWHSEESVCCALEILLEARVTPFPDEVKALLDVKQSIPCIFVKQIDLRDYDAIQVEIGGGS